MRPKERARACHHARTRARLARGAGAGDCGSTRRRSARCGSVQRHKSNDDTLDARANLDDMPALAPNIAAQASSGRVPRQASPQRPPLRPMRRISSNGQRSPQPPRPRPIRDASPACHLLPQTPPPWPSPASQRLRVAATALTEVDLQLSGHAQPLDWRRPGASTGRSSSRSSGLRPKHTTTRIQESPPPGRK